MFELIKQVFIALLSLSGSLASMANVSNFTTYISPNHSIYDEKLSYWSKYWWIESRIALLYISG